MTFTLDLSRREVEKVQDLFRKDLYMCARTLRTPMRPNETKKLTRMATLSAPSSAMKNSCSFTTDDKHA